MQYLGQPTAAITLRTSWFMTMVPAIEIVWNLWFVALVLGNSRNSEINMPNNILRPERPRNQDRMLGTKLLTWYQKHKRPLVWRKTKDPYRIWIAEVMLQQTQVSRVEQFYPRFIERFSTCLSLAKSNWQTVLPFWRGLGYYQRGRNLLDAARIIETQFSGKVPRDFNHLTSLPGIGPYTANAILCFAFGQPRPALDTNVKRVLSRVYALPENLLEQRAAPLFLTFKKQADLLNHALMDLGSLLCKSTKTNCNICPLAMHCFYARKYYDPQYKKATPERRRVRSVRSKMTIDVGIACIHNRGKYLIGKRKSSAGGYWEFPGGKREGRETIRQCLKRESQEELGVEISVRPPFFRKSATEGGFYWRLHFCRCQILHGRPKPKFHSKLKWVAAADLASHALPPLNKEAIQALSRFV